MEKETYKTAKLILERFDPDSKKAKVRLISLLFYYKLHIVIGYCNNILVIDRSLSRHLLEQL